MIDEAKGQRKVKGKRTCAGNVARRNERIDTRSKQKDGFEHEANEGEEIEIEQVLGRRGKGGSG
jgi:hypothetical protein